MISCSTFITAFTESSFSKVTNLYAPETTVRTEICRNLDEVNFAYPKPRELPVLRSTITTASFTMPNLLK
jgi:hypothetical protein